MKTRILPSFLCLLLAAPAIHAEKGDMYLVAKTGLMEINYRQSNPNYVIGVYGGYSFNRNLSVEGEFNYSLAGGGYHDGNEFGKFSIGTAAGYGVHRSPITPWLYLKAKVGLLAESIAHTVDNIPNPTTRQRDLGFSGGLGVGAQVMQQFTLEAEYTMIEKNVAYMSLGLHYPF